jgi:hypothetical protein
MHLGQSERRNVDQKNLEPRLRESYHFTLRSKIDVAPPQKIDSDSAFAQNQPNGIFKATKHAALVHQRTKHGRARSEGFPDYVRCWLEASARGERSGWLLASSHKATHHQVLELVSRLSMDFWKHVCICTFAADS